MKVVVLSLCILTAVIDASNDGVVVLELSSPEPDEIEYVSLTTDVLPPGAKEGERVFITTIVDEDLQKYCHSPL